MNHFRKIAEALPGAGLDGVLLTGEHNRFYASGFASMGSDGAAWASLVTQMFTNVVTGFLIRPIRRNNRLMFQSLNPKLLWEMAGQIRGEIKK